MKYKEFTANIDGLEKKLGVLGELHKYTYSESELARNIVKEYTLIASEGHDPDKMPITMWFKGIPIIISGIPNYLVRKYGTDRSSDNPTTRKIAEEYIDKDIIRFNDNNISWTKVLLITAINTISMPLAPINYLDYKINGDPSTVGTKAYYKEIRMKDNFFVKRFEQLIRYCVNADHRDKIMADKSMMLLSKPETTNLLINCGEGHFEGIINRLYARLDLKETGKYIHI